MSVKRIQQYIRKLFHRVDSIRGFTLAESAVALAAISALVVVVINGSEMVRKAKLSDVLSDINQFTEAIIAFEEKYETLPGDLVDVSGLAALDSEGDKGNGNGVIDGGETLLTWRQLAAAKLIDGNYDGISTYVPGVGVPKGSIEGSGYYIFDATSDNTIPDEAVVIVFAGFTTNGTGANNLGVLSPKDAQFLDNKIDDGLPNRGMVRGINGAGGGCISGGIYAVDDPESTCYLRVIIRTQQSMTDDLEVEGCSQVGQTRESPDVTKRCPVGYSGKIMETCRIDLTSGEGAWQISKELCAPVTCPGGKSYGERRVLSCMNGQTGNGIVETCSQYGVWQQVESLSDCTTPSDEVGGQSCTIENQARLPQACSWARAGRVLQTCVEVGASKYWTTNEDGDSCELVSCTGGSDVGIVRSKSEGSCGSYYSGVNNDDGQYAVSEACLMDGTWQVIANECSPQYGSCLVGNDVDRDIGCPPGEVGSHTQTCVESEEGDYWITVKDSCEPMTCSGESIGSVRILKNTPCSDGRAGVMMEVCHTDGTWQETDQNCTTNVCIGAGNTDGNAIWPNAANNSTNVAATSCTALYHKAVYPDGAFPTRNCDANANWGMVSNACIRIQCPYEVSDHAQFPSTGEDFTDSGPDPIAGECEFGYENATEGIPPTKQCSPTGNMDEEGNGLWENLENACVAVNFSGIPEENLVLWLDASQTGAIVQNDDCHEETPGANVAAANGNTAACWYDKSVNRHIAFAVDADKPTYRTNILNSRPVLRFNGSNAMTILDSDALSAGEATFIAVAKAHSSGSSAGTKLFFSKEGVSSANSEYSFGLMNAQPYLKIIKAGNFKEINDPMIFDNENFHIYAITYADNSTVTKFFMDGVTISSGAHPGSSFGNNGTTNFKIGGRAADLANRLDGDIAELILYDAPLSMGVMADIHTYLADKWGITLPESPPGEITEGLTLWLDGQDEESVFTSEECSVIAPPDGAVRCWLDKSVNSEPALITGNSAPIYETNMNGDFGLKMNDDAFATAARPGVDEQNMSLFAVYELETLSPTHRSAILGQWTSASQFRYLLDHSNGGVGVDIDQLQFYSANSSNHYGALSTTNPVPAHTPTLVSVLVDESNYLLARNGVVESNNITTLDYSLGGIDDDLYIGGNNTSQYNLQGNIGEILLYNRKVDTDERDAIESALATKWDILLSSCVSDTNLTVKTDLQVWLDANDLDCDGNNANNPADNSSVSIWADKSGNGRNAVVNGLEADDYPLFEANGMNSKSVLQFRSGDLEVPAFASGSSFTVMGVFETPVTGQANIWEGDGANNFVPVLQLTAGNVQGFKRCGVGMTCGLTTKGYALNELYLASYVFDSDEGKARLYVNGTSTLPVSTNGSTGSTSAIHHIGADFQGALAEVLFYTQALSVSDRQTVESYLGTKWGIAIEECQPDNDLPYTSGQLQLWLDAADVDCDGEVDNDPENNTDVSIWKDKSEHHNDAIQDTVNMQPTYIESAFGGNPSVQFIRDMTNTTALVTPSMSIGHNFTIFLLLQNEDLFTVPAYLFGQGSNVGILRDFAFAEASPRVQAIINGGASVGANVEIGGPSVDPILITLEGSNDLVSIYKDGNLEDDGAMTDPTEDVVRYIGSSTTGAVAQQAITNVGELLVYDEQLSSSNRKSIQQYLANKWGVMLACEQDNSLPVQSYLDIWYDATDPDCDKVPGNNPSDGTFISLWRDKSGHNNDAYQASASLKPTYKTSIFNTKPAMNFDDDYMDTLPANFSADFSYFLVFSTESNGITSQYFFDSKLSTDPGFSSYLTMPSAYIAATNGTATNIVREVTGVITYTPTIISYVNNQGTQVAKMYKNGALGSQDSLMTNSPQGTASRRIGASSATTHYLDGNIAELLVYQGAAENGILSDTNRKRVEAYLSEKWNITLDCAADSSLPYQTSLSLWLDANDADCDGNSFIDPDNGDSVQTWRSKVGIIDASQADDAKKPTYRTGQINSKPVIRFGEGNTVRNLTTTNIEMTDNFTAFMVFKPTADNDTSQYIFGDLPLSGNSFGFFMDIPRFQVELTEFPTIYHPVSFSTLATDTVTMVSYVNNYTENLSNLYKNGTLVEAGTVGRLTGSNRSRLIGGGMANYFIGDAAEILIYNDALTNGNRQAVEDYLSDKWGL